ncbi:MAG: zinc-ribbon domain-containing protein [Burkholderiales bacterium]|jgi:predicted Zn finger-like uncharacterized protein|nr:zinc-ribbon domain-containing protein [Burkholderiales bacterium]
MSLITRCPACTTMFRVVADQLKVAQGWVRCGQCGKVFDASLHLVPGEAGGQEEVALAPDAERGLEQPLLAQEIPSAPPEPADAGPAAFPANEAEAPSALAETPEAAPEAAFVRDARRSEFWAAPQVRALLGLASLLLLAALMLQWMVRQKDVLAAQEPRLAPLLQALCRPLGCQVRPLRRIESLVIENASFRKTAPDAYRLVFVFRNTGDVALEIPALEVTLTDSQDQALVRRVVMPAQFGATASTLGAHSELAGALSLKVAGDGVQGASSPAQAGLLPVAGYRILAFYP